MAYYGISAIHWNANLGEIDEVQLRKIVRQWREGVFKLSHAEPAWCSDVVGLIRGGDKVWVMVPDGSGKYKNTDRVRVNVKRDGHPYLYSCTGDGTPTSALTELPRYLRPDDAAQAPGPSPS
jgi:hypothetical protein